MDITIEVLFKKIVDIFQKIEYKKAFNIILYLLNNIILNQNVGL